MQHEVQQVERRTSGWKGWGLGPSNGLRGGTQEGESPYTGKAGVKEAKEQQEQQQRNGLDDFLAKQREWRKRREEEILCEEKRHKGDGNSENVNALHYGSAAIDLDETLESELKGVECEDSGENMVDKCESKKGVEIGDQGELNKQGLSDEEEASTSLEFLKGIGFDVDLLLQTWNLLAIAAATEVPFKEAEPIQVLLAPGQPLSENEVYNF